MAALLCFIVLQPTGIALRVMTADVGELGNPQRKIIAVQAAYTTDSWTFTQADVRPHCEERDRFVCECVCV